MTFNLLWLARRAPQGLRGLKDPRAHKAQAAQRGRRDPRVIPAPREQSAPKAQRDHKDPLAIEVIQDRPDPWDPLGRQVPRVQGGNQVPPVPRVIPGPEERLARRAFKESQVLKGPPDLRVQ